MIVSVIVFQERMIRVKAISVENNVNDVSVAHKIAFFRQQTSNL
jgi:hypothetical protein